MPLSCLLLLLWLVESAARQGSDASAALTGHGLYAAFALLHGKLAIDRAAAGAQTTLPPLSDLPFYLLTRHLAQARLVNALLALPAAIATCLLFLLTLRVTRARDVPARLIVLVAVVFGATGAAAHPLLGTSLSDMPSCALILAALLLLLGQEHALAATPIWPTLGAGLLAGWAIGLHATLAYAAGGIIIGLLAWTEVPALPRMRLAMLFAIGTLVGFAAIDGWWCSRLIDAFGSPTFPFYNGLFGSPSVPPSATATISTIGTIAPIGPPPPGTLAMLLRPFRWAIAAAPAWPGSDQHVRDPRIALGLLAALALWVWSLRDPALIPGRTRFMATVFVVGFALWATCGPDPSAPQLPPPAPTATTPPATPDQTHTRAIPPIPDAGATLRALSMLELLSGSMLAMLALAWARGPVATLGTLNVATTALYATLSFTLAPYWGRLAPDDPVPLAVTMPHLADGSLVLMLDTAPLAFLAAFQSPSVRFYGVANALVRPGLDTPLARDVRDGIAAQLRTNPADLWGLDRPDGHFGETESTLAAYGLHRGDCQPVIANIAATSLGGPTRLCRLTRQGPRP